MTPATPEGAVVGSVVGRRLSRGVVARIVLPVAFLLLGCLWAVASPPGSSADDDYHLTSIWCAWGTSETCLVTSVPGTVFVPQKAAESPCYALDPYKSGTCWNELPNRLVKTTRINPTWGTYPPGFYLTMRAFVGDDVARSVLLMRVFNVALAAAALAAVMWLCGAAVRRAAALAWVLALIPTVIFFVASTNPSSWTITGVGVFWAFLLTFLTSARWRSRRALLNLAAAVLAALIALASRADASVYLGASIIAVTIVAWPRLWVRVRSRWKLVTGLGVAVGALLLLAGTNLMRYTALSITFPGAYLNNDQPTALVKMLLEFPSFMFGVVGGQAPIWTQRGFEYNTELEGFTSPGFTYGVGWTDVFNPSMAGLFVAAAIAGAFFIGFASYTRRRVVAVAFLLVFVVVQAVIMRAWVGFAPIWYLQPRYFIPIILVILGLSLYRLPVRVRLLNPLQRWTIVILLSVASAVSFTATMWRYTLTQTYAFSNLSTPPEWWWDSPVQPLHLVIAAAIVGTVLMIAGTALASSGASSAAEGAPG